MCKTHLCMILVETVVLDLSAWRCDKSLGLGMAHWRGPEG